MAMLEETRATPASSATGWRETWRRLKKNRGAVIGLYIVLALTFVALFAPYLAPYDFKTQNLDNRLLPPERGHWLGTDDFGRDTLSRIIYGTRVSFQIGLISVGIGLAIGVTAGLISGYYGGILDKVIMGFTDVVLAFPGILLAIAIVAVLGPGLYNVMVAVGLRSAPTYARLVRGSVMSLREKEFVESSRAVGCTNGRILAVHILPNVVAPVLVMSTLQFATSILTAAGLSFLGLGAQPPIPDWGDMINRARVYLRTAWWVGTFPGVAIMLSVLGFNLFGDGLRDALDPRLKA